MLPIPSVFLVERRAKRISLLTTVFASAILLLVLVSPSASSLTRFAGGGISCEGCGRETPRLTEQLEQLATDSTRSTTPDDRKCGCGAARGERGAFRDLTSPSRPPSHVDIVAACA